MQVAQDPFDIAGRRDAARARADVAQLQHGEFHRLVKRDIYPQLAGNTILDMLVHAVAKPVACQIVAFAPGRQCRGRPDTTGILVAQVEGFPCAVAHRIVMPGRQAKLVRVFGPGVTGRAVADDAAELRIGQHVRPRRRSVLTGTQSDQVFAAISRKRADTVIKHAAWRNMIKGPGIGVDRMRVARRRLGQCEHFVLDRGRLQQRHGNVRRLPSRDLFGQFTTQIADDDARDGLHEDAILMRNLLPHPHEDATGAIDCVGLQPDRDQPHDLVLQLLPIPGLVLVPDDQIDDQSFQAPICVGLHHLPDEIQIVHIVDLHQHHRIIAGNSLCPQPGLTSTVLQQHGRLRTQGMVCVDDQAGETLVELCIGLRGVDLPAHDLVMRPCEIEDTVGQPAVAVFVDQRVARPAGFTDACHHVDAGGLFRSQRDPAANRDDGIQHGPLCVRQDVMLQCIRRAWRVAATNEARTIGFVGNTVDVGVVHRHQVQHPFGSLFLGTWSARAQDCLFARHQFALHEQIAEGRMQFVGDRGRQDDFGIGGDFDCARRARSIGDVQAAQLDVVFRRHGNFDMCFESVAAAAEFGLGIGENRLVTVDRNAGWLIGRRPESTSADIAQITETAPMVAGGVFAPARHRHFAQAAVTTSSVAQHHVVAPIRQHLHCRARAVGIAENAQPCFGCMRGGGRCRDFTGMRMEHAGAWDAFLQQQHGRLEFRIGTKSTLHRLVAQQIEQRQQTHALVMRHERSHQRTLLPARYARRGVVDRFVVAETADNAFGSHALQVLACSLGRDHQRHHAGVWRDHQVLRQPTLQPETGHTERTILIIHARIDGVVAAFGNTPRHVALPSVFHLALDRCSCALVQQRAFIGRHHQLWHQVLEHRSAPRQQRRIPIDIGKQSSQREPAFLRQLILRNGDEVAQPCLRGKQVVVARIEPAVVYVVADGQQVSTTVVQEPVIHLRALTGNVRQTLQLQDPCASCIAHGQWYRFICTQIAQRR